MYIIIFDFLNGEIQLSTRVNLQIPFFLIHLFLLFFRQHFYIDMHNIFKKLNEKKYYVKFFFKCLN